MCLLVFFYQLGWSLSDLDLVGRVGQWATDFRFQPNQWAKNRPSRPLWARFALILAINPADRVA